MTGTRNKGQGCCDLPASREWIPGSAVGRGAAVEFCIHPSPSIRYCLTLALVMNLEVLRERSNQSVLLGLLVLVCESRCVCMGSPCLGKRQGNLKKPDVNKVDTILGYRLSHLIAIVSPSAKAAGRGLGLAVSQRRCVSGGNGRALIIQDWEREGERETCGEIGRDNTQQDRCCCRTLGIFGREG
jgi:hypothetical protein